MTTATGFSPLGDDDFRSLNAAERKEYEYAKTKGFPYPLPDDIYFSKYMPLIQGQPQQSATQKQSITTPHPSSSATSFSSPTDDFTFDPTSFKKDIKPAAIKPNYGVVPDTNDRIWRSARPGYPSKADIPYSAIANSMSKWKKDGVTHIMVMISDAEQWEFYDRDLVNAYSKSKFRVWRCPIVDFRTPTLRQACMAVNWSIDELQKNKKAKILLHCSAGIGRTGTMLACLMHALDMPAIQKKTGIVRAVKASGSCETTTQVTFIEWFRHYYKRFGWEPK
jgi:protein-tyrosine phosphatase